MLLRRFFDVWKILGESLVGCVLNGVLYGILSFLFRKNEYIFGSAPSLVKPLS